MLNMPMKMYSRLKLVNLLTLKGLKKLMPSGRLSMASWMSTKLKEQRSKTVMTV